MYIAVLSLLLLSLVSIVKSTIIPNIQVSPLVYNFQADVCMKQGREGGSVHNAGRWLCKVDRGLQTVTVCTDGDEYVIGLNEYLYCPKEYVREKNSFTIQMYVRPKELFNFLEFDNVESVDPRVSFQDLINQLKGDILRFRAKVLRDGDGSYFGSDNPDFKSLCEVDSATMKMTVSTPKRGVFTCIDLTTGPNQYGFRDGSFQLEVESVKEVMTYRMATCYLCPETFTYKFQDIDVVLITPEAHNAYHLNFETMCKKLTIWYTLCKRTKAEDMTYEGVMKRKRHDGGSSEHLDQAEDMMYEGDMERKRHDGDSSEHLDQAEDMMYEGDMKRKRHDAGLE